MRAKLSLLSTFLIVQGLFLCLFAFVANVNASSDIANNKLQQFNTLLKEAGLIYRSPKGFRETNVEPFYLMPHEKALISEDGKIEVRYIIRPLNRIQIDYEDPHNSAPHPNDLFEMLFRTLTEALAEDNYIISRAYTVDQSRKLFNAGWGSVAVFDIPKDSGIKFKQVLFIAIHQNDMADAYIVCLTNDLNAAKPLIKDIKQSLKFAHFEKGINMPNLNPATQ